MAPKNEKDIDDPQKVKLGRPSNADIIPDAGKVYLGKCFFANASA
jgi:hypothetical protein